LFFEPIWCILTDEANRQKVEERLHKWEEGEDEKQKEKQKREQEAKAADEKRIAAQNIKNLMNFKRSEHL